MDQDWPDPWEDNYYCCSYRWLRRTVTCMTDCIRSCSQRAPDGDGCVDDLGECIHEEPLDDRRGMALTFRNRSRRRSGADSFGVLYGENHLGFLFCAIYT